MDNLIKACAIAVSHQEKKYGRGSISAKIRRISETNDVYLFDFCTEGNVVIYGGGGLIVYKKDFVVDHYCLPSYPSNIFDIVDNAKQLDIPKEFKK